MVESTHTNVVPNVRNIKASMHTTQILLGPALASLLMAVGMTSSASTFNDRRVIVAYGSPGSAALDELQQLIDTRRCELLDRDVDVHIVDAKEIAMLASIEVTPPAQSPTKSRTEARVASLIAWRGDGEFELVLVGKDGGVKARATKPEALDEFLDTIDRMPMRRAEIQRRGSADKECKE